MIILSFEPASHPLKILASQSRVHAMYSMRELYGMSRPSQMIATSDLQASIWCMVNNDIFLAYRNGSSSMSWDMLSASIMSRPGQIEIIT